MAAGSVRETLTRESGGHWHDGALRAMMGMSSLEWSSYMHDELGVPMAPEQISDAVVGALEHRYRERLPLIPGAREAVKRLAERWQLPAAIRDCAWLHGQLPQALPATALSAGHRRARL